MNKRAIAVILAIAFVIALMGGCCRADEQPPMGDAGDRFEIAEGQGGVMTYIMSIVDHDTGVQYLLVLGRDGCGVTPLLNSDGTLCIVGGGN